MRIVINTCYGGFSVSEPVAALFGDDSEGCDLPRNDPTLVAVVQAFGERASGSYAALRVIEIPDGIDWTIEDYDGREWVAERHRVWDECGEEAESNIAQEVRNG